MMIRPSNSGIAIWVAESSGVTPSSLASQSARGCGQAQPLEDRDVERGDPLDVPGLVVAAGTDAGRAFIAPPAASTHDHQRVERAQRVVQLVGGGAQRGGEDRHPDRLTGRVRRVDGVGQRVREAGVAADLVRPVVQHADPYGLARSLGLRPVRVPPRRDHRGRVEALTGEQHRVGEERVQLGRFCRAALGEVAVRLAPPPRSAPSSSSISSALGDRSPPSTTTGMPVARSSVSSDSISGGDPRIRSTTTSAPVEHRLDVLASRVARAVGGPAGPRRQQVGVGRGQQSDTPDSASGASSGFSPLVVGCLAASVWLEACACDVDLLRTSLTVAEPPRS